MSIYTRRGDRGETSLADGTRVRKDCARVEAYGTVDEANSFVGLARVVTDDPFLADVLRFAQHRLFNCSAVLAAAGGTRAAGSPGVSADDVAALEAAIDRFDALTGAASGFVLEGGSEAAARLHAARAVLRRSERRLVALDAEHPVDEQVLAFINRLSDVMFAAARYANAQGGTTEELWDANVPRPAEPA